MGTRIGVDNLVYAIMSKEDTVLEAPVYGAVKPAVGVMTININPNGSQETLFADDGPFEVATTLGNIEVEIQKAQLTTENKADLLGHQIDENGAIVYADNDIPPWVAIGFRTLKSNGKYRYVWLYKGKFTEPEDNNETKGDGINWQADTIHGQFVKISRQYKVNSKLVRPWKYELDEDYEDHNEAAVAQWFDEVMLPGKEIVIPASELKVAYAAGATAGSTVATLEGEIGTNNHLVYKVGNKAFAMPEKEELISGGTEYTIGEEIVGVDVETNKYITIIEVTASNRAVACNCHELTTEEIAPVV